MYIKKTSGPRAVILPGGKTMTRADLPSAGTRRWVASRKAAVVRAVTAGLISSQEAMAMYDLSEEEPQRAQLLRARMSAVVDFESVTPSSARNTLRNDPEMDELLEVLAISAGGPAGNRLRLSPGLARGLGYYTGPIFEITVADLDGSLGGGGGRRGGQDFGEGAKHGRC